MNAGSVEQIALRSFISEGDLRGAWQLCQRLGKPLLQEDIDNIMHAQLRKNCDLDQVIETARVWPKPSAHLVNAMIQKVIDNYDELVQFNNQDLFAGRLQNAICAAGRCLSKREKMLLSKKLQYADQLCINDVSVILSSNEVITQRVLRACAIDSFGNIIMAPSSVSTVANTAFTCEKRGIGIKRSLKKRFAQLLIKTAVNESEPIGYSRYDGSIKSHGGELQAVYWENAAKAAELCNEVGMIDKFVDAYAKHGNLGSLIKICGEDVHHYELVIQIAKLGASDKSKDKLVTAFLKCRNFDAVLKTIRLGAPQKIFDKVISAWLDRFADTDDDLISFSSLKTILCLGKRDLKELELEKLIKILTKHRPSLVGEAVNCFILTNKEKGGE